MPRNMPVKKNTPTLPRSLGIASSTENGSRAIDVFHQNYFADEPVYDEAHFCHRFRMSCDLSLCIVSDSERHDQCFDQTTDLEAVAFHDLWIWHDYHDLHGSLNDINALDRSQAFSEVLQGGNSPVSFVVDGHTSNTAYYLAGGISQLCRSRDVHSPPADVCQGPEISQERRRESVLGTVISFW